MIYLLYILVILFFLACLYQLDRNRNKERKKKWSEHWISIVMGILSVPIVMLLEKMLLDFGVKENLIFYISLVILLFMALTIRWIHNKQLKNAEELNGQ